MKIDRLSLVNALGQEVYGLLNPANTQELDIFMLPKGIYFLKVQNKQGQSVFKIVKE